MLLNNSKNDFSRDNSVKFDSGGDFTNDSVADDSIEDDSSDFIILILDDSLHSIVFAVAAYMWFHLFK